MRDSQTPEEKGWVLPAAFGTFDPAKYGYKFTLRGKSYVFECKHCGHELSMPKDDYNNWHTENLAKHAEKHKPYNNETPERD